MLKNAGPDGKDYLWYKFNVFTRWLPGGQTVAVIFDLRDEIKQTVLEAIFQLKGKTLFNDPYWIHTCLIEQVVHLQDDSVWSIRDLVRETEKSREDVKEPKPDYPKLHDIARHAIHVTETLDLATKTANSVITHHHDYWSDPERKGDDKVTRKRIADRLKFYDYMLRGLRYRNASNKERLTNEIQLVCIASFLVAEPDVEISIGVQHRGSVRQRNLGTDRKSSCERQCSNEVCRNCVTDIFTSNFCIRAF
jgi:hypothetical protein